MSKISIRVATLLLLLALVLPLGTLSAQENAGTTCAPAEIANDEGGPVAIHGEVTYTNPFFTAGTSSPLIILEDQTGFVTRNRGYVMPVESQVIGQITSDFYTSPFTYSVSLPIEPQAPTNDVDNDGETDKGVMVYAIAYWTNTWGDPFLEVRDLGGGGWSSAYVSTEISPNPSLENEIIGGTMLVYAPDDQQCFPSSFGEDGLLFTGDEPTVALPQGYTVVSLETDPFTFDRSRVAQVDLVEGGFSEVSDFSEMSYTEAFDAMIEKLSREYAFTELKGIDWEAMSAEFRPRFEEAEANQDPHAYALALRDFAWAIPDAHVAGPFDSLFDLFLEETNGGLGMAIRDVDDGRVITNFILEDGPAAEAGIELRAEILEINGQPIDEVISANTPWSGPFSAEHVRRLQQLRYAIRFPVGTEVEITYQNPGDTESTTVTLTAVEERQSFSFSSFNVGLTGFELPVEYELLDNGYAYVKIYSFFDDETLSIALWERMIETLNANAVPGLIIDMRQNGGGSGWLADQMAAYFFDEELVLGNAGYYDETLDDFYVDPNQEARFYLPPEDKRYRGPVAVLVGPNCASACEFFSYNMTLNDRAAIVGQYPTAGAGGSVEQFYMPEGEVIQTVIGRNLDAEGNIIIEGTGVVPTVQVPVDEETLFSEDDPILEAAVTWLDQATAVQIVEAGEINIGDEISGQIEANQRVRYTLSIGPGDKFSIFLEDADHALDTYLRIYVEGSEEAAAENDDADPESGGTAPNSAIVGLEGDVEETIIIEVGTYDDASAGTYTLRIVNDGE